jgi:hypothetical protein
MSDQAINQGGKKVSNPNEILNESAEQAFASFLNSDSKNNYIFKSLRVTSLSELNKLPAYQKNYLLKLFNNRNA